MRCKLTEVPPNLTTEMFMMVALRRWANAQRSNSPSRDRWKVLTRREDEQPTQSQISTSILKYTTITDARAQALERNTGKRLALLFLTWEVFRVQGAGCRVQGAGCRVQGAGFRVQGAGFRVQGALPLPSEDGTTQTLLPESQGHNLAFTVLCVPCSLGSRGQCDTRGLDALGGGVRRVLGYGWGVGSWGLGFGKHRAVSRTPLFHLVLFPTR